MALSRAPVPVQGVTWVGPTSPEAGLVQPGDRGVFIDYDGQAPDGGYVVKFPGGRVFCCQQSDVQPDARPPVPVHRRHKSKGHRT